MTADPDTGTIPPAPLDPSSRPDADIAGEDRERVEVPDAVQEADVSERRRRDLGEELPTGRARGVEWVRMSDLLHRHTQSWAGRGIDLHEHLVRGARSSMARSAKNVGERMHRRLPPASAFGRHGHTHSPETRPSIGRR